MHKDIAEKSRQKVRQNATFNKKNLIPGCCEENVDKKFVKMPHCVMYDVA